MDRTNKMNKPRQSKYKNKRTKISGKTFDSAIEARYYRMLTYIDKCTKCNPCRR